MFPCTAEPVLNSMLQSTLAYISVQPTVSNPIRWGGEEKTLDVESSIHLMGYGKAGGARLLQLFSAWSAFVWPD